MHGVAQCISMDNTFLNILPSMLSNGVNDVSVDLIWNSGQTITTTHPIEIMLKTSHWS